jgi:hypothetical protein
MPLNVINWQHVKRYFKNENWLSCYLYTRKVKMCRDEISAKLKGATT